ncbi:MAG: hypothetical protein WCJ58_01195 [bacterium]
MKKALLTLIIAIFFTVLMVYLTNALSPWNTSRVENLISQKNLLANAEFSTVINDLIKKGLIWQVIDWKNFFVWIGVCGCTFVCYFSAIHLFIDKLFFKKFHENPDLFTAGRRGVIIFLIISSYIGLRIVSGQKWYNILGIIFLGILVELIFMNIKHKKNAGEWES